jgi:hypothetical protein
MLSWSGWLIIKSIIEALYCISGIVIAVVAVRGLSQLRIGLEQIRLTKEIARVDAQREALRFAVERCQYFAEVVVPGGQKFLEAYLAANCTFFQTVPKFRVTEGEIIPEGPVNHTLYDTEATRLVMAVPIFLNAFEAFAIPFVARVADDDLGYQETGTSFCAAVKDWLILFYKMRGTHYSGPYQSTITLYERWTTRRKSDDAAQALKNAEATARKQGKPERVDPLGT